MSPTIDSSGYEQVVQLWRSFPVFETVGENAQCPSLWPRKRFVARGPVREYARKSGVSLSLRSVSPFGARLMELLPATHLRHAELGAEP